MQPSGRTARVFELFFLDIPGFSGFLLLSYPVCGHENSKTTMDIYAKVKYNKPEELFGVVNGAFHQAIAE